MNQFHIYEAIGRGKHSVVYKGRKKRTVEYVAIKSTDRTQKNKVLQEVKVMHSVKHPNVLRFYAWYETSNHLWLILEFCVGGDLQSLLRSDKVLPEATVLRFGRDLAGALQYLHSVGTLHCDLCPSNLLLDENGRVKLGGFSLSRRVGDIGRSERQGTSAPLYTAPEVLQGSASPSTSSDLWSLGCVLYECAAGRPPFLATSLSSLRSLLDTSEPPPLIGSSPELQDLVGRLLSKDPASRMGWAELCAHPFWGASPLELLQLPEEMKALPAPATLSPQAGSQLQSASSSGSDQQLFSQHSSGAMESDGTPPRGLPGPREEGGGAGLEVGATPLHPSSRQRMAEEPSEGETYAPAQQQLQQPSQPPGSAGAGAGSGAPPDGLDALIWHPTDAAMKPIVGNKRIQRAMESAYAPSLLPFKPLAPAELLSSAPATRVGFLQSLQRVLSGSAHQHTKLAMLAYLESLALDSMAAHEVINSELCIFMVRMLHNSGNAVLRARLANALGLLVRHASVVQEGLAKAGLVAVLSAGLGDTDLEAQRRSTAALGELLFYIASQQRDPRSTGASAWVVPGEVLAQLVGALGAGRDEVVQHYVAKTIENIAGQAGPWAHKFANPDVISALAQMVGGGGSDAFRGTAASALCRLLRCKPSMLPVFLDQGGLALVTAGMDDSSPRVQQASITILCLLLSNPGTAERAVHAAEADSALLPAVGGMLEHPADVLKAKGLVAVALLVRSGGPTLLGRLCSTGVLQRAERGAREQGQYISLSTRALKGEMAAAIPALLAQVTAGLRVLQQQGPSGAQQGLPHMPTLLHLLGSPLFRGAVVSGDLVAPLADILTRARASGSQEAKEEVLQAIDGVCGQPDVLVQHYQPVLTQLLPALSAAVASSGESSDTRFVCLKLLCDIVLQAVTEPALYLPADAQAGADAESGLGAASALVDAAVGQHVLPLAPALLADEDPMPLYALKMLGVLLEVNPGWVRPLAELGLARRFFEWLSIEHPHNNVHNIRLCRLVAGSGALPPHALLELQALDRVLAVLSYAHEAGVDPFLEPSLELAMVLLEGLSRLPAGASETGKFLPALPLLLELCLHPDEAGAAAAAACLGGVVALHPEDAAAILAADNGPALLAAVLQQDGGAGRGRGGNEAVAFHLLHALAVAAAQPAFARRRDAMEGLAGAARQLMHGSSSTEVQQAAAAALEVLGTRRLAYT